MQSRNNYDRKSFQTLFCVLHSWLPQILLTSFVVLSAVALWIPELTVAWQYDRPAIEAGQWWRLLTGHLTHWNFDHWIWDATTFWALGIIACRWTPSRAWITGFASAFAISGVMMYFMPQLQIYRGLSGIDTALFMMLAVEIVKNAMCERDTIRISLVLLCMAGLIVKTGFELLTGSTLFVNSAEAGFITVVWAHVVGVVIGAMVAVAYWPFQPRNMKTISRTRLKLPKRNLKPGCFGVENSFE